MDKKFINRIIGNLKGMPLTFSELADRVGMKIEELDDFAKELAGLISQGAVEIQDKFFVLIYQPEEVPGKAQIEPPKQCPGCGSKKIACRYYCKMCRLDLV